MDIFSSFFKRLCIVVFVMVFPVSNALHAAHPQVVVEKPRPVRIMRQEVRVSPDKHSHLLKNAPEKDSYAGEGATATGAATFLEREVSRGITQLYSRRLRNQLYQRTPEATEKYVPGSDGTYSQNYQDKWLAAVAEHNGWDKAGGFFLDLGAFNGLKCSNSALAEKKFGWKGVCVEARPVPGAFSNRSCLLVQRALSKKSGEEVTFYGTPGTQLQHINKQRIDRANDSGEVIKTLNVPDLFDCVSATDAGAGAANELCKGVPASMHIPSFINFISLDIEGQGLHVLQTFPFERVKVGVWIAEREDSSENQSAADKILLQNGYIKVPVENAGVDNYWMQPQFWDPSLAKKELRIHPTARGSEC